MNKEWLAGLTAALVLGAASAGAAEPAPAGAGEWSKLYADEDWYRNRPGEEQVFRGKLETVQPPEVSTLMRDALYKLSGRTIRTRAGKIAALDALAGKEVEIRGKAVDMDLEGQSLKEIWPAAVRAAKGGAVSAAAPDAATATALARDYLVRNGAQAEKLRAFRIPAPASDWWMVEYVVPGTPRHGSGPVVYVNSKTGEVTRQGPKGMPGRM